MTPLPAPSPNPFPFAIHETPEGEFQLLLDGVPVDIGEPIECPHEADAFLRAANSFRPDTA